MRQIEYPWRVSDSGGIGAAFPQGLGSQFGEVVSQGGEAVLLVGAAQRRNDVRIDFGGAERAGGRDVSEADESVHQRLLSGVVELEAGNAFAGRRDGGRGEPLQLAAVNKRLENVLLDIQVSVVDRGELVAQGREMLDGFVETIVVDVVARRLGAKDAVVTHVLLDEAVAVVTADDRVGQVHVLDLGL